MRTVISIRWNLPIRQGSCRRDDPRWHKSRLDLFGRYCAPSLLRQTVGDWEVRLYCAAALPEQNEALAKVLPDARFQVVPMAVGEHPIITDALVIRLDSDDMLHPEAIAVFREAAASADPKIWWLQPKHGYAYAVREQTLYRWRHPVPAVFAAVVRPGRKQMLPHMGHHARLPAAASIRLERDDLYCISLHETNVCNCVKACYVGPMLPTDSQDDIAAQFGLTLKKE